MILVMMSGFTWSTAAAHSATVSVEIVPAAGGSSPRPENDQVVAIPPGALSASIILTGEPVPQTAQLNAHLVVQDHRGVGDGWDVRLTTLTGPSHLSAASLDWNNSNIVWGGTEPFQISGDANEMPLGESPKVVEALQGSGAGTIVTQLEMEYSSAAQSNTGDGTFQIVIPSAP